MKQRKVCKKKKKVRKNECDQKIRVDEMEKMQLSVILRNKNKVLKTLCPLTKNS